jgi:chromate reductase, NAD(P)H dehydrogenase (quinone)
MTQIAMIVGSLRRESYNRRLAEAITAMVGDEVDFIWPDIGALPLYNQDDDSDPPQAAIDLKSAISGADGLIFVTPEYNRSIPGVLKNALDHASRPYGESAWKGKPAAVIGISPGQIGTSLAQQHLRSVLSYLDMPTLKQPEIYLQLRDNTFAADGTFGEDVAPLIRKWLDGLLALIARYEV